MINAVMAGGFRTLTAYMFVFALISLIFFIVTAVINAVSRSSRFYMAQIRGLFTGSLGFMTLFALLDYFLV